MKKSRMVCALGILAATFGSTAKAVPVNPANWDWSLVTYGEDVNWLSPTNVEPYWPKYEWSYSSQSEILVAGDWYPGAPASDSNTADGLPFDMIDEDFEEPGVLSFHMHAYVNSEGWGHIDITNVWFGQVEDPLNPGNFYNVTGARFQGNGTIEGVPEPATLVLLGAGEVWILSRKKRPA